MLALRNRVMLDGPATKTEADTIFSLIIAAVRRAAGHKAQHAERPTIGGPLSAADFASIGKVVAQIEQLVDGLAGGEASA